ncbi:MAG: type III secretion protein, partial [Chlamydiia bacterium]|nr:type III secretion protein [Chlamydiia bacterium]
MKAMNSPYSARKCLLALILLSVLLAWTPAVWAQQTPTAETPAMQERTYTMNFNDVSIIEFIRFISRITGKNFIFDEKALDFNVTIVSSDPTSVDNIMAALLQVLRINDLTMLEQGNNVIIHKNSDVRRPARVITDRGSSPSEEDQLVTRVYRLDFADPKQVAEVLRPLVSKQAQVKVLEDSRNIVVTDLATNVSKVTDLIESLDRPNTALDIGQYVAQNLSLDSLIALAEKILRPIAADTPLILTPQQSSNSVFVISTPYFVKRSMTVLETLDVPFGRTRILSFDDEDAARNRRGSATDEQRPGGLTQQELQDLFPKDSDFLDQGVALDKDGNPILPDGRRLEDLSPEEQRRFGRKFRDPRDFRTPELFFDFGQPGSESEFELSDGFSEDLPIGHIDTTHFYIHKLEYRNGEEIQISLQNVAASLSTAGTVNIDLLSTISSAQWIKTSNSIVFTGTRASLDKVKDLIREIDTPLRQVLIEMLIIETTIDNSLSFGVEIGSNVSNPYFGGSTGFYSTGSSLATGLAGLSAAANVDATSLAAAGLSLGAIGKAITHNGEAFSSLGVLLKALQSESDTRVIMNPKIITEDNSPAEIFVGTNERYNAQTISNEGNTNLATNYEFRDVGSTLNVTPL